MFKPGDRVEIINVGSGWDGKTGTLVEIAHGTAFVDLDFPYYGWHRRAPIGPIDRYFKLLAPASPLEAQIRDYIHRELHNV